MEISSIKVDDSLIHVDYFRRLLSASFAMILSFIVFILAGFFISQLLAIQIAVDILPIISFVPSIIIFLITFSSEVLLKRLIIRWGINELKILEKRMKFINSIAIMGAVSFVVFNLFFSNTDVWVIIMPVYAFVSLILLMLFFVLNPFTNFYNTKGRILIGLTLAESPNSIIWLLTRISYV
jgi:hypothetical protein